MTSTPPLGALPESLAYLPAYVRAEVEAPDVAPRHFVRWLLQFFEANVHLAERIHAGGWSLLDPDEGARVLGRYGYPLLGAADIADPMAFVSRLAAPDEPVSEYLWGRFEPRERELLRAWNRSSFPGPNAVLLTGLNRIINGPSIYERGLFAAVRFSPATRTLVRRAPLSGDDVPRLNRRLLEDAFPGDVAAMPEARALAGDEWQGDWLRWLAGLLDLDLDPEWIPTRPTDDEDADAVAGAADKASPSSLASARTGYGRIRRIIKAAPRLYRWRGTPRGLRRTVRLFYDCRVEVLERSWPRGMSIGISSMIGVDSLLVEPPRPRQQFTVLIEPAAGCAPKPESVVPGTLMGTSAGRAFASLAGQRAPSSAVAAATKLRALIDQQKPAHLQCFLAFAVDAPPRQAEVPAFQVGVASEVEWSCMG